MRSFFVLDPAGVMQMINRAELRYFTLSRYGASQPDQDRAAARVRELEATWSVLSGFRPRTSPGYYYTHN